MCVVLGEREHGAMRVTDHGIADRAEPAGREAAGAVRGHHDQAGVDAVGGLGDAGTRRAVLDVGLDHRIAAHLQDVGVAGRGEDVRNGERLGGVLVRLDRAAGGDLADDRQDVGFGRGRLGHELARQPETERRRGRQPDRPRLGRPTLEVTLAFEDQEVMVDSGGGSEPDRVGDLPDRRRIPSGTQRRRDVVEDLRLALGVVPGHGRLLSPP